MGFKVWADPEQPQIAVLATGAEGWWTIAIAEMPPNEHMWPGWRGPGWDQKQSPTQNNVALISVAVDSKVFPGQSFTTHLLHLPLPAMV